jgi:glycosyltransferase involved in cell wall biosynthesis
MKLRVPGIQTLAEPQGGEEVDFRAAGDRARGRGEWADAVANYKSHLARQAGDFDIWVQLGHASKETGDYAEARAAYSKAVELRPKDFDVYLNKGHLEKLAGQQEAAITAYKKAFELNPKNLDALREIVGLGGDVSDLEGADALAVKTIYVDMTDLIVYVQTNASLSGIQRVVANLIEGIDAFSALHENINVVPVIPEYDKMRVFSVNRHLVLAMIEALHKGGSNIQKAVDAVYATRVLVKPKRGDIFTIAGAFWIYPHYDMIQRLRENGVKFVIFIHDLIQISHPQYVHKAATLVFRRALIDVLKLANGVLTNTEFVAGEVRQFMRENLNFEIPVKSVFLSTELTKPSKALAAPSDKVQEVLAEPYALSVSTIEVRKNHMYMVKIWERLIREKVPNIPNLVFVGKLGWDIEPFQDYLDHSDQLEGRLKVLSGVTDAELSDLYKGAMFTMFPSFVEGFGLPVGESLAYGKPVISSNRASMPEVGGKFARYVDPDDIYEGFTLVRDFLTHPDKLAQWTAEVQSGYRSRTWREFAIDYLQSTTEIDKADARPVNGVFEAGDVVGMGSAEVDRRGDLGKPLTYLAPARRVGWHAVEPWGCWASARRATLHLPTRLAPNSEVCVYLHLQTPGRTDPEAVSLHVDVGGRLNVFKRLQPRRHWVVAEGRTDAEGAISISIVSSGRYDKPDTRELFVGLASLGFCKADDLLARITILERIVLEGARVVSD